MILSQDRRHDFGNVVSVSGRRLDHRYLLTNKTSGPIKILEAINYKPCCGTVRAEKMVLGPGESGAIDVSLSVGDRIGRVDHSAEIVTDAPTDGRIELQTSAVAFPQIRVEDNSETTRVLLEGAKPDRAELAVIVSTDRGGAPLDLDRLILQSTRDVAWVGPKDLPREDGELTIESRRFSILLDAETQGPRKVEVLLKDGDRTLYTHALGWDVVPAITVSPKVVVLRRDEAICRIVVRSHDQRPFRILNVDGGVLGLRGRVASESASATQVVEADGRPSGGQARGVITLSTDHPSRARVEVPVVVIE